MTPCYAWHRHLVFTPAHGILHRYLPCYIWHWYLPCYIWHRHLSCYIWHRYLSCYIWHMIPDTGTWCVILDTCSLHPVYDMLSCGINTWTWHRDFWPDTTTPDTCVLYDIFMAITFTGTWLLYYYHIFGTPELLYTWTPEIRRLLTLLLMLYSCWSP